jgi:hypothetical protein
LNKESTRYTSYYAKVRNSLAVCFIVFSFFFLIPTAHAEEVTTIVTNGGDDISYLVPLTVPVVYDGVTYQNVYATTNSVITFGNPDNTYWAYPQTPSISIESRDWWALPYVMHDTHFIISVSSGGFQVDGAYRPYGSYSGNVTNIVVTAQIRTDGTVAYTYAVNGPLWGDERTGARLVNGNIVTLEQAGVTQVEEAPVLEPTPVSPTPEPLPEPEPPAPEPQSYPQPSPAPQPEPLPVEEPPVIQPELPPTEVPEEQPEVAPEPPIIPEVIPTEPEEPSQPPIVEVETIQADEVDLETLAPDTPVELDNGVVVTAEVAIAVALLQDPGAMLQTLFTDPTAAFAALGSVGADMTPEVRAQSEKVVIAAVIAGNIATTAATSAAGAAAYRRKQ